MDQLKDKEDDHDTRFDQVETRTSDFEDGRHASDERLLQIQCVLEVIRNRNEDPEAHSTRNNFRMLVSPSQDGRYVTRKSAGVLERQRRYIVQAPVCHMPSRLQFALALWFMRGQSGLGDMFHSDLTTGLQKLVV
ncbi:hypothetical protein NDU88_001339 [Pleurodeles waltl]|uniref:Uncharacterized protein n=1 Tax=Pleurodeles waltl TaxID=8319 RepID=A0AAV7S7S9_PLEWA|nr:hypothetical protein NDU88_001339 [Pleurodeles waltl]